MNNSPDPKLLAELTNDLEQKKKQLETELSAFATKDPQVKGDWDSRYPRTPQGNLEEAADEVEEYSTCLPIEFNLETQLKDVQEALQKIEKGTYGICEKCGETIGPERLKVSPEARLCQKCKE
ncbi:MAG: TraR/DksA C4-type zinc finger protein [Patescibacteria group bacterium]